MLSHDEFRQQKGDFEMKKEQNRHSLHLIRQKRTVACRHCRGCFDENVPRHRHKRKRHAAHHMSYHRGRRFARARHFTGRYVRFAGQAFLPHGAFSAQRHGGAPIPHRL